MSAPSFLSVLKYCHCGVSLDVRGKEVGGQSEISKEREIARREDMRRRKKWEEARDEKK